MVFLTTGPGEYERGSQLGKGKQGLLCSRDERFRDVKSTVPGPGSYEVCIVQIGSSFLYLCVCVLCFV